MARVCNVLASRIFSVLVLTYSLVPPEHRPAHLPQRGPDYFALQCTPSALHTQVLQLDEPESVSNGAQPGAGKRSGNGAAPPGGKANGAGLAPLSQSLVSIHAGERAGRPRIEDMLTTPIALTSTYFFKDTAELIAYQEGRYGSYEYGRWGLGAHSWGQLGVGGATS